MAGYRCSNRLNALWLILTLFYMLIAHFRPFIFLWCCSLHVRHALHSAHQPPPFIWFRIIIALNLHSLFLSICSDRWVDKRKLQMINQIIKKHKIKTATAKDQTSREEYRSGGNGERWRIMEWDFGKPHLNLCNLFCGREKKFDVNTNTQKFSHFGTWNTEKRKKLEGQKSRRRKDSNTASSIIY